MSFDDLRLRARFRQVMRDSDRGGEIVVHADGSKTEREWRFIPTGCAQK